MKVADPLWRSTTANPEVGRGLGFSGPYKLNNEFELEFFNLS